MNINYSTENFRREIYGTINQSKLPVSTLYFVLKDVFNDVAGAYEAAVKSDPETGIDEFLAMSPKYKSRIGVPRILRGSISREIDKWLKEKLKNQKLTSHGWISTNDLSRNESRPHITVWQSRI